MNYMKLIKLLYLADRKALLDRGWPITGDRMVSMPKGPVLSGVLDLINWGRKRQESSIWLSYISEPLGLNVHLASNITIEDLDVLSDSERSILDAVYATFGKVDRWSLVEFTHQLPEWQDPRGSSIPIDPANILRAEGRSEREISDIARNAAHFMFLQHSEELDIEPE
jgi:uncharacterized phage-associated protein